MGSDSERDEESQGDSSPESSLPTLHIITGPPGAGKLMLVYSDPTLRKLPIYCCYHYNKVHWSRSGEDCILLAYASHPKAKQHWLDQAHARGFTTGRLYEVLPPDRATAMDRMHSRPSNNRLSKEVNFWYKNFAHHPRYTIVPGPNRDYAQEQLVYGYSLS